MKLDEIESIAKCQCGYISFNLKCRDKMVNISEKSFKKAFDVNKIPENALPLFKCGRCLTLWKLEKGTSGDRANRPSLVWG